MKKQSLRHIGDFEHISEKSLKSLESITKIRQIDKNEILYYEGDLLKWACMLISGRLELYKMDKNDNELFLCYVESRAKGVRLINAFGSFKPYEAAASVRGIEPSVVAFIELESLELLIKQDIEISNAFLSAFMDKVIVFKNFINFKEVYDSTSRVGHLLYTELERFNKVQRQVIAHELNIKLETLSRILQKMQQQGLLGKDEYGDLQINDKHTFASLFGNVKMAKIQGSIS
ncbi:Crp/Fnr family transcriptional regulator [uncultured Helicobacter sp.]|uniref:Crp/Fnr family transcriptional regulator n=1 Tax=uncultured Helicobacter sp. TaxID=175537 RepID=UPI0025E65106|nr:Crp/Fnr family transcriptional regulator [uncultured Helicobacter sp.]